MLATAFHHQIHFLMPECTVRADREGQAAAACHGKVTAAGDVMRHLYRDRGERDRRRRATQRGSGKLGATIYINITSVGRSRRLIMT